MMTDREYADELQKRVRLARAIRKESEDAHARLQAAEEARNAAHAAMKAIRKKAQESADSVRELVWGNEPLDPSYEVE